MPDTLVRYPGDVTALIGTLASRLRPRRLLQLWPSEPFCRHTPNGRADKAGRTSAALERQDRTAGIVTGYLRGSDVLAEPVSHGTAPRLVSAEAPDEAERRRVASFAPCLSGLTLRQVQVLHLVLAEHPSKNIAADLSISQRTVENHRAAIMKRTGATSLPALARMAVGAGGDADRKAAAPADHHRRTAITASAADGDLIGLAAGPISRGIPDP